MKALRKLGDIFPTLLGVSLLTFFSIRFVPGDPVMLLLGERGSDPQTYQEMKIKLGLDKHPLIQYREFVSHAFNGDLGKSIVSKRPVIEEFFDRFPATFELGIVAMFFATLFGIPFGIIAAVKRNSLFDYLLMGVSLVGYSMPIFWWGLILILVFSVKLPWTPVSGRIDVIFDIPTLTGFYLIDTLNPRVLSEDGLRPFLSAIHHLILPSIAMGTIPLAIIARITRSSMLDVLGQDYIRTAKAKGMPRLIVIGKHAFRNALIPIVTVAGLLLGSILTGAILTETIFSWPGIGKWLVASINARDYPVIQVGALFLALLIVVVNLSVDWLYAIINPTLNKTDS